MRPLRSSHEDPRVMARLRRWSTAGALLVILLASGAGAQGATTAQNQGASPYTLVHQWTVPPEDGGGYEGDVCPTDAGYAADGRLIVHSKCRRSGHGQPVDQGGVLVAISPDGSVADLGPLDGAQSRADAVAFTVAPASDIAYFFQGALAQDIQGRPLADPLGVTTVWRVLGAPPMTLATGPNSSIAAGTMLGIGRYGPGSARYSTWPAIRPDGSLVTPGAVALDTTGNVYVVDQSFRGEVHKYSANGLPDSVFALTGLADQIGPVAAYPGRDEIYVLNGGAETVAMDVRVFDPAGAIKRTLPVSPDLSAVPRPMLAVAPDGGYALIGEAGGRHAVYLHSIDGQITGSLFFTRDTSTPAAWPRLDVTPSGDVLVKTAFQGEIWFFDGVGAVLGSWTASKKLTDVAHAPNGDAVLLLSDPVPWAGSIERRDQQGQLIWSQAISSPAPAGIAVDNRFVYSALFYEGAIQILSLDDGTPVGRLSHRGTGQYGPMDLDVGPDGRLYALDRWSGEIDVWDIAAGAAAPDEQRPVAIPDEAEDAAIGPDGQVAVVTIDGRLEVKGPTGDLVWSFGDAQVDPVYTFVRDVAFDAAGHLVVLAAKRQAGSAAVGVFVFEPARSAPTPLVPPSPTPRPTPPPASQGKCSVTGLKTASPDEIVLGESVVVTLSLSGTCPSGATGPADVMLVVDTSGSMRGEKASAAAKAVAAFVSGIDLTQHRVGIVTFAKTAGVWHELAGGPGGPGVIPPSFGATGGTDIALALDLADDHLIENARPGVNEVIVLLSDGNSSRQSAISEAEEARERGVQIHSVALGEDADLTLLMAVAGHPSLFHLAAEPEDLEAIYRTIAAGISGGGVDVVVDDTLGADVELVSDTVAPPPWSPPGTRMLWRHDVLPKNPITIEFRVRPLIPGLIPTNREAFFDYRDSDGRVRRYAYPIPKVRVIEPSPAPTATSTPTATPTPTPTPTPTRPAYLPVALREKCVPGQQRVDVALVIDTSTSMRERTPSGVTKLMAAQDAASAFVDILQFDQGDQAAVIAFNRDARVMQNLTSREDRLKAALGGIQLDQYTCLVCAVDTATAELTSKRRRAGNLQVMVLLTDGRSNPRPASEAVVRAAQAKSRHGIVIFTIGLGSNLDFEALTMIASKPAFFHVSSTADDLRQIYSEIAREIPCPADWFWGKR